LTISKTDTAPGLTSSVATSTPSPDGPVFDFLLGDHSKQLNIAYHYEEER